MCSHSQKLLVALSIVCSMASAQEPAAPADADAVPLDPVSARPPDDPFTEMDRRLRALKDSLPNFGTPSARKPGLAEQALRWSMLPSEPEPVSDAEKLSAEEHLRNSGRSREQLP